MSILASAFYTLTPFLGWWTFTAQMHATMLCGQPVDKMIEVRIDCKGNAGIMEVHYDDKIVEFRTPENSPYNGKVYGVMRSGPVGAIIAANASGVIEFQLHSNEDSINWIKNFKTK